MAKIFCSGKTKQRDSRSVTGQLERGKQAFVCLDDIFPTKQPPDRYRARAQRMERFRKTLCARSVFSSARKSRRLTRPGPDEARKFPQPTTRLALSAAKECATQEVRCRGEGKYLPSDIRPAANPRTSVRFAIRCKRVENIAT